jgi:hypothetical protein
MNAEAEKPRSLLTGGAARTAPEPGRPLPAPEPESETDAESVAEAESATEAEAESVAGPDPVTAPESVAEAEPVVADAPEEHGSGRETSAALPSAPEAFFPGKLIAPAPTPVAPPATSIAPTAPTFTASVPTAPPADLAASASGGRSRVARTALVGGVVVAFAGSALAAALIGFGGTQRTSLPSVDAFAPQSAAAVAGPGQPPAAAPAAPAATTPAAAPAVPAPATAPAPAPALPRPAAVPLPQRVVAGDLAGLPSPDGVRPATSAEQYVDLKLNHAIPDFAVERAEELGMLVGKQFVAGAVKTYRNPANTVRGVSSVVQLGSFEQAKAYEQLLYDYEFDDSLSARALPGGIPGAAASHTLIDRQFDDGDVTRHAWASFVDGPVVYLVAVQSDGPGLNSQSVLDEANQLFGRVKGAPIS